MILKNVRSDGDGDIISCYVKRGEVKWKLTSMHVIKKDHAKMHASFESTTLLHKPINERNARLDSD